MRYAILILLTTSLFGPIFGICMLFGEWEFTSAIASGLLALLTFGSLLTLMVLCGAAREKHPKLVRNTLNFMGTLVVLVFLVALICMG